MSADVHAAVSDLRAYVRHDLTGREGLIVRLDPYYRALVTWVDDGRSELVPRRHLIVLRRRGGAS